MINIISKSYSRLTPSGPKKVVENLIRGLDQLNYPYVINRRLDACKRLWVHDDIDALWQLKDLSADIKAVVGPNLFVKPGQVPKNLDLSRAVLLQPSQWAADFWMHFGWNSCPIQVWATGINTQEFIPSNLPKKYVLLYHKQRSPQELALVKQALEKQNINYKVLVYPKYHQTDYKKLLAESRYIVWLGRQESQGIALQEALSCNVPILVCDVERLGHWDAPKKEMEQFNEQENAFIRATSAEYFDHTCGIKIKNLSELDAAIASMEQHPASFRPREYILNHLSLKKQARDFVEVYNKYFGLNFEQGFSEKVLKSGYWKNNKLSVKAGYWVKDLAKIILKAL